MNESQGVVQLRVQRRKAELWCQVCGDLIPPEGEEADWLVLTSAARDHARDLGHEVAVELKLGAVYAVDSSGGSASVESQL